MNLARAAQEGKLTPEVIQSDEQAMTALANWEISEAFLRTMKGYPFYVSKVAPTEESSNIAFERHFNPALKHDSEYFNKLSGLLSCVDRNSSLQTPEEQNAACANEMRALRMAAFNNELFFHNVNQRFYMDLKTRKSNETPYWFI